MTNEQKYKVLVQEYKKQKQMRENLIKELAEHKGTLAVYESEREEQIKKAKKLGVEPNDLKSEIEKLINGISEKIEKNKKLCSDLENNAIG